MLFTALKPMLLLSDPISLTDPNMLYENKIDGFRCLLHRSGDRVELYTRHGNIITPAFPEIVQHARQYINADNVVLDGELCVFLDNRPNFDLMANRSRLTQPYKIKHAAQTNPATYMAFDILFNGTDLTGQLILSRKKQLVKVIEPTDRIMPVPFVVGDGEGLFKWTLENNWEGIIGKSITDSNYLFDARPKKWYKVKHWRYLNTVILGYRVRPFGLLVGAHFRTIKNKPIAMIEHGFSVDEKRAFLSVANQIVTRKEKDITYVEPVLACEVKYLEATEKHNIRIASFERFLFGYDTKNCVWVS